MKLPSELRQDMVTGDWIAVATGRARRPDAFAQRRHLERPQPKRTCPFERLLPETRLVYDRTGRTLPDTPADRRAAERAWWLQVVPNKYPAFVERSICPVIRRVGPYAWLDGVGFHEVIITRDHLQGLAAMTPAKAQTVLSAYRERYRALRQEKCVEYIAIFHNHGREAGATISHPHSQLIAIPVVPPDVRRSLRGSAEYAKRHGQCVHCTMVAFELSQGWRIVAQNRDFITFCPYASRQAFEVRIFPRRHRPDFGSLDDGELVSCAGALRTALAKLSHALGDPAYNFFIHTAPTADGRRAPHYHWHIEIVPKTAIWAGFEIGTGIEIASISPEAAARYLRSIRA